MNESVEVLPRDIDERRGATSASNAYADELCPGRHIAQRGKSEIENPDSDFGTAIHLALATGDSSNLDGSQLKIFEMCQEITDGLIQTYFGSEAATVKRFIETRFWCKVRGQYEHSAKPDLVLRSPTKALILEYKTLPGDVQGVARNRQVRDQVVLIARHLLVKEVGAAVVQPLVTMSPNIVQYNEEAINISEREMFVRVEASNDENSERRAGKHQCGFCRARVDCKPYLEMVSVSVPTKTLHELAVTAVASWTPEQRAQFLEQKPIATKWIDEVNKEMKRMVDADPSCIPGWELQPGSIKRPVRDIAALHDRTIALGGNTESFLACVDMGKGDFESMIRKITGLKGKALKAKMDELLAGITDEVPDAKSLGRAEQK